MTDLINYDFLKNQLPNPATPLLDKMGIDMGFFSGFPPLKTKYIDHQLISLYIATQQPYYLFALKMALGKTWIASQTIRYHHFVSKKWEGGKVLFVCPRPLNCVSIAKDFNRFIPDLTCQIISKHHNWDRSLNFTADIILITYDYLANSSFLSTGITDNNGNKLKRFSLKAQGSTRKDKNKDRADKQDFIQDRVYHIVKNNNIVAVFYDEIHNLKNIKGIRFNVAKNFSDLVDYRYGLSGTPTSEKITEIWPIARLIDRGETFGDNEWRFKNKYFQKKEGFWGSTYTPRTGSLGAIKDKLSRFSISFTKQEVGLIVPPIKILRVDFELGAGAKSMYRSIEAGNNKLIKAATFDGKDMSGIPLQVKTNYTKLRQICSGTLIVPSADDDGESEIITFEDNQKVKKLISFLRSTTSQVVIFYDFTGSHLAAIEEGKKYGITFGIVNGKVSPTKKEETLLDFISGNIQFILIHYLSGNAGLNLQMAQYVYSLDVPQEIIILQQVRDRIARPGQIHQNIAMIIPCAKGTLEQRVADKLQSAGKVVDYLYGSESEEVSEEDAQNALMDVLVGRQLSRHKDFEHHPILKLIPKRLQSTPTTEGKWNLYIGKSPIYEVVITFKRNNKLWIRDSSDIVCPIDQYPTLDICEWEPHVPEFITEQADAD